MTARDERRPCVFCEIVHHRAPAKVIRQWDDAVAIEPLNPVVPGHWLVIPVEHVAGFFSSPDVSAMVMHRAAEMLHGVENYSDHPLDYNVITSVGRNATQTVKHLHVHLVPRHAGDGLTLPWTGQGERRPAPSSSSATTRTPTP